MASAGFRVDINDLYMSLPKWATTRLDLVQQYKRIITTGGLTEAEKARRLPAVEIQMIQDGGDCEGWVVKGFETLEEVVQAELEGGWPVTVWTGAVSDIDACIASQASINLGRPASYCDRVQYLEAVCLTIRKEVVVQNPGMDAEGVARRTLAKAAKTLKAQNVITSADDITFYFQGQYRANRDLADLGLLGLLLLDPSRDSAVRKFVKYISEQMRLVRSSAALFPLASLAWRRFLLTRSSPACACRWL